MAKHNQQIGKWGEDAVAAYPTERGYELIARNARATYGEIGIVAKQADIYIFVEVKTRTSNKMGLPEASVNLRKQTHMLACTDAYAAEHEINHWQIDVIAVEGKVGTQPKLTQFENAI